MHGIPWSRHYSHKICACIEAGGFARSQNVGRTALHTLNAADTCAAIFAVQHYRRLPDRLSQFVEDFHRDIRRRYEAQNEVLSWDIGPGHDSRRIFLMLVIGLADESPLVTFQRVLPFCDLIEFKMTVVGGDHPLPILGVFGFVKKDLGS